MSLKTRAKKIVDSIMGKPAAMPDHEPFFFPNRKQKRVQLAMDLKVRAEPNRRKYEKRGVPGRSSKGRRPHR